LSRGAGDAISDCRWQGGAGSEGKAPAQLRVGIHTGSAVVNDREVSKRQTEDRARNE
jgi:hypothetical protein